MYQNQKDCKHYLTAADERCESRLGDLLHIALIPASLYSCLCPLTPLARRPVFYLGKTLHNLFTFFVYHFEKPPTRPAYYHQNGTPYPSNSGTSWCGWR